MRIQTARVSRSVGALAALTLTCAFVGCDGKSTPTQPSTPTPTPTGTAPVISGIQPSTPTQSSTNQTIAVSGSGFQSGLTLNVGAPNGATSTLSGSQIQNVSASSFQAVVLLSSSGSHSLRVNNPSGQSSNLFSFNVQASSGTTPAPTTYTLSGAVTDTTSGGAISGSSVRITDGANAGKSASTDGTGRYAIPGIAPGTMTVSASKTSYQTASRTITLTADTRLDFPLQRTPDQGDRVITFRQLASGYHRNSEIPRGISVIRDQASWSSFLATEDLNPPSGSPNFSSEMAIVVSYGSGTWCANKTQIDQVIQRSSSVLEVTAAILTMPTDCGVDIACPQEVDSPFDAIAVPKSDLPVTGTWIVRVVLPCPCGVSLTPYEGQAVPASGGSFTFTLLRAGCSGSWYVTTSASWITLTGATSGTTSPAGIPYSVAANTSTTGRTGVIVVSWSGHSAQLQVVQSGAASTPRCVTVAVPATAGGTLLSSASGTAPTGTGLSVSVGDRLTVSASGTITIFGTLPSNINGPNGYNWWPDGAAAGWTFLLEDSAAPGGEASRVAGALVGRIGSAAFIYLGTSKQLTAASSGEVTLGVNDMAGNFSDNSGSFAVQVCRQ